MLPERLSNGLCSLNPRVDRLVLSAVLDMDARGRVTHADFAKGVIRSSHRMTYTEVARLVEQGYGLDLKPLRSVGYRHMGLVLKDEMSVDEALELMKRDTRRLAKRQLTWFRGEDNIQWYHPNDKEKIVAAMERFLS